MNCESPTATTRWPLLRIVPGHTTDVELLSGDWVRLATHYSGRTLLCSESAACAMCELSAARHYWYLPACVFPTRTPTLLELSASSSADLEQRARLFHGGVGAGCVVRLSRKGTRAPIRCEVIESRDTTPLLAFQTWVTALMAIFCLPALGHDEPLDEYSQRVLVQVLERAKLGAARLRAGAEKGVRGRS